MTKGENLNALKKKADKAAASFSKKGLLRKRIMAGVLALGSAIICLIGAGQTKAGLERNYQRMVEENDIATLEDLDYKDTFELWNGLAIGNDVNVLLSGGKMYSRYGISVLPSVGLEKLTVVRDGKSVGTINGASSFINVWENAVYYRDDSSRNICKFDLGSGKNAVLLKSNVGEVFVTESQIFYTDFSAGNRLYAVALDGKQPVLIVDAPVDQFVVLGGSIVYRGFDNTLKEMTRSTGAVQTIGKGVERFFFDGGMVIESDDTIYHANPNGTKPVTLYTASDDTMRLVGAMGGAVFFQEEGKLFMQKGEEKTEIISKAYRVYTSLLIEGDSMFVVAYSDETAKLANGEVVQVELDLRGDDDGTEQQN